MISTYSYFGIMKILMNWATSYYISGYTPETPKNIKRRKYGFEFDNSYQWTRLLIIDSLCYFPCKGKCIWESKKNILSRIEMLYYFLFILIRILLIQQNGCNGVDIPIGSKILKYDISKCEYTIEHNTIHHLEFTNFDPFSWKYPILLNLL